MGEKLGLHDLEEALEHADTVRAGAIGDLRALQAANDSDQLVKAKLAEWLTQGLQDTAENV
jgi:hypothetical protein